ncbi:MULTISPECIES: spore coat protein GerQ [Metabacillus]|uniref:Spore coat protein GerQ n=1 Tax=Metabacillus hrfriensis TaxID=3048891 RepID=A0ACD4RB91_9BACI|nr:MULTISPECIES: spore coat protein GerQ [Metabacillus]UOK57965.1 spore coat protein GerQ [Bacillus sp. OVS6]USK28505.1 spore coat protein GerQ [Bacillus sp. CMF21]UAL52186.1 spore coat protein GerQ [Metabacillus dongyingensis]UOK57975.1 spore coat protein GerQ [Bacillus sp. OVS6]WHZ57719.1 spore coat protein GerQ [Metabacillus sp. CT-WN-B3]
MNSAYNQFGAGFNPYGAGYDYRQQQPQYGYPQQQQQQGGQQQTPTQAQGGMLPLEESYIENILRLNRGKVATVYMTFEASKEWNSKIFKGVIEAAGRDHIILSDQKTAKRYLLLMVYLDYITFDEEIAYYYPYDMTSYPPR